MSGANRKNRCADHLLTTTRDRRIVGLAPTPSAWRPIMTRFLQIAGDSLLSRLVPAVSAGACVPTQGQICCSCCDGICKRFNCIGQCVKASSTCC